MASVWNAEASVLTAGLMSSVGCKSRDFHVVEVRGEITSTAFGDWDLRSHILLIDIVLRKRW